MTDLIQALTQQNNSYEKGNFKHGSLRGLQTSALKGEKRISYWHWALELYCGQKWLQNKCYLLNLRNLHSFFPENEVFQYYSNMAKI